MTRRVVRSLSVPVSRATLFAWHERPGAFERLAPPWQRVEVLHSDGRITDGAEVALRARVAPHPALDPLARLVVAERWRVVHRDHVPGRQFRDELREGPFPAWSHLHRMDDGPAPGTSVLTDAIDYALPFGALGDAVGGAFADAELARLLAYRHAVTAGDLARHAEAEAAGVGPLTVAITGASGLVGSALVPFLTTGGHRVVRIGRGGGEANGGSANGGGPNDSGPNDSAVRDVRWDPAAGRLDPRALEGVDVVIHLAGANVGERWTAAHKQAIRDSRVQGTRLLAETLARLDRAPRALVSMSAVGIYGDRGDEPLADDAAPGRGFLAEVGQAWEAAADPARRAGIRVVHPRLGVVLTPRGGALPKLMLPFQLGAGGKLGSGRQWMPWIALDDVVGALWWLAWHDALAGAVNLAAPGVVPNAEFARVLGHVLHRPSFAAAPAFALRLALGREQADEVLLAGQRVVPRRLTEAGFRFRWPELEGALRHELGR